MLLNNMVKKYIIYQDKDPSIILLDVIIQSA